VARNDRGEHRGRGAASAEGEPNGEGRRLRESRRTHDLCPSASCAGPSITCICTTQSGIRRWLLFFYSRVRRRKPVRGGHRPWRRGGGQLPQLSPQGHRSVGAC
jgi:hypothetical protein